MIHIYIDAEYLFTVALRENQVPNYKTLIEMMKTNYLDCIINIYFVGSKDKKRGLMDFLHKMGVNYIHIIELSNCSKTQVMGSALAWDVCLQSLNPKSEKFVFVSGDDYLVPIVDSLMKDNYPVDIYYASLICSRGLTYKDNMKMIPLSHANFMYPVGKEITDGNAGYYKRTKE